MTLVLTPWSRTLLLGRSYRFQFKAQTSALSCIKLSLRSYVSELVSATSAPSLGLVADASLDTSQGDTSPGTVLLAELRCAVLSRDLSRAQTLMRDHTSLQESSEALRWMLRGFTMTYDFTTAKKFLLSIMPAIGSKGIYQFLNKCARSSQNPDDIMEVMKAVFELNLPIDELAVLVGTSLMGLKVLRSDNYAAELEEMCITRSLSRHPAIQQVKIYELYLEEEFNKALQKGRIVHAALHASDKSRPGANGSRATINPLAPYRTIFTHFCKIGDLQNLQVVIEHIAALGLLPPASFSGIALRNLPSHYPEVAASQWLQLCLDQNLEINLDCLTALADNLGEAYPSMTQLIWSKYDKIIKEIKSVIRENPGPAKRYLNSRLSESVLTTRHSPFWKHIYIALQNSNVTGALEILDKMRERGIKPPYRYYVSIFEAAAKSGHREVLSAVHTAIVKSGYALHCAGTDLAMLELLAASENNSAVSDNMINAYLMEYPLSIHDRLHLTRLSRLVANCTGDFGRAAEVVDSLRTQSSDQRYNCRNHDTRSLYQLLWLHFRSGTNVVTFMEQVLADKPQIIFDDLFIFRLETLSSLQGNTPSYELLKERIPSHNAAVQRQLIDELDTMKQMFIRRYKSAI